MRTFLALVAALLTAAASVAHGGDACSTDGRYVMGTVLQVELCTPDRDLRRSGMAATFATAQHLDELFTTFSPDSPTSRLNARAGEGDEALPPEVVELLALSREYAVLTGGTFDVTVGPLVALWREAGMRGTLPNAGALSTARARVGSERVVLSADGRSASLPVAGMAVDFGGIGKGYALDRLVARLRAAGIDRALLDFGRSSIWALDRPPDGSVWKLLLEHPAGGLLGVIGLRDQALSVSGSLAQGTEIGGRRYGHVIDPRTGWPLERDLLAAVVAPSAALAEALSKSLLLLGENDGIALLERFPRVEGMLAEAGGASWMTRGWTAAVAFEPAREAHERISRAPDDR